MTDPINPDMLVLLHRLADLTGSGATVDLAQEAISWETHFGSHQRDTNPLLDPVLSTQFITWIHEKYGIQWSYGGYLEDRSLLWRGSYLDPMVGGFLHAGIDLNCPEGTAIRATFPGRVLRVLSDVPLPCGWGTYVIIAPVKEHSPLFVYGHLGAAAVAEGQLVAPTDTIGTVGGYQHNGFWFPHLHLQAIQRNYFDTKLAGSIESLDGYFPKAELSAFSSYYPEPLAALATLSISNQSA